MVAGEFAEAHGAAGVELVGGDADLGAEAELATVGEAGGDIVKHAGGIHGAEEMLGHGVIRCDDAIGVVGAVGVDVIYCFCSRTDDLDGEDEVEVFRTPVLFGGGDGVC